MTEAARYRFSAPELRFFVPLLFKNHHSAIRCSAMEALDVERRAFFPPTANY
jgi:hypothetical protein